MDAKITKKTNDKVLIFWEDGWEFGNIKIEWDHDQQRYLVDAELIGIDRLMKVLKNIK
jgi:hypothetical protein